MCWAEKCCYWVPLNKACVILGITNFIISFSLTVTSLACYIAEHKMEVVNIDHVHYIAGFFGLELKVQTVNIILSIIAIICIFWMIFSVLLIFGVIKNEPSLILSFFSFGIILTIICMLSGLLLVINQYWAVALVIMILSMINIHYLVVVHSLYDLMQKGNYSFQRNQHQDLDPLEDCFDNSLDV